MKTTRLTEGSGNFAGVAERSTKTLKLDAEKQKEFKYKFFNNTSDEMSPGNSGTYLLRKESS